MFTFYRQPGKTGMEMLSWVALECRVTEKAVDLRHARLSLDPLILRAHQVYMPGLKPRRLEFATEQGRLEKSVDPTSRWRVKQAAYQRSENRGHAKCEENFVRNFTHLPPSLKLDTLIFRQYQVCMLRGKLHRLLMNRLIFEDYLALNQGDKPYKFYKSKCSRARNFRAARPAKLSFDPLIFREYQVYMPGLKPRRFSFALERGSTEKSASRWRGRYMLDYVDFDIISIGIER